MTSNQEQTVEINIPFIYPHLHDTSNEIIKNTYIANISDVLELANGLMEIINNHQNVDYLLLSMNSMIPQINEKSTNIDIMLVKLFSFIGELKDSLKHWSILSMGLVKPMNREYAAKYTYDIDTMTVSREYTPYKRNDLTPEVLESLNDNNIYFSIYIITEAFKYITMQPGYLFDTSLPMFVMLLRILVSIKKFTPKSVISDDYYSIIFTYTLDLAARSRYIDFWKSQASNDYIDRYMSQIKTMYKSANITENPLTKFCTINDWRERMRQMTKHLNSSFNNIVEIYDKLINISSIDCNLPSGTIKVIHLCDMYHNILKHPEISQAVQNIVAQQGNMTTDEAINEAISIIDQNS